MPRRWCRCRGSDKGLPKWKIPEFAGAFARRSECPEQIRRPIATLVVRGRFPLSVRFLRTVATRRYALRAATFRRQYFARSEDRHVAEFLPPSRRPVCFFETNRTIEKTKREVAAKLIFL